MAHQYVIRNRNNLYWSLDRSSLGHYSNGITHIWQPNPKLAEKYTSSEWSQAERIVQQYPDAVIEPYHA